MLGDQRPQLVLERVVVGVGDQRLAAVVGVAQLREPLGELLDALFHAPYATRACATYRQRPRLERHANSCGIGLAAGLVEVEVGRASARCGSAASRRRAQPAAAAPDDRRAGRPVGEWGAPIGGSQESCDSRRRLQVAPPSSEVASHSSAKAPGGIQPAVEEEDVDRVAGDGEARLELVGGRRQPTVTGAPQCAWRRRARERGRRRDRRRRCSKGEVEAVATRRRATSRVTLRKLSPAKRSGSGWKRGHADRRAPCRVTTPRPRRGRSRPGRSRERVHPGDAEHATARRDGHAAHVRPERDAGDRSGGQASAGGLIPGRAGVGGTPAENGLTPERTEVRGPRPAGDQGVVADGGEHGALVGSPPAGEAGAPPALPRAGRAARHTRDGLDQRRRVRPQVAAGDCSS